MRRFVAGVRWAVRAKDAGRGHMQCHMGATEDAGSRRTARPGGTRLIVLESLSLWLPVVIWAGLIFALSSIPDLGTGLGGWDLVLRKIAHAAEFAVLGYLLLRALGRELPALAAGIAYAASDELHQTFVTGREGTVLDVLVDTVGVAVGVYLVRRLRP